jgi:hypothetical protein
MMQLGLALYGVTASRLELMPFGTALLSALFAVL